MYSSGSHDFACSPHDLSEWCLCCTAFPAHPVQHSALLTDCFQANRWNFAVHHHHTSQFNGFSGSREITSKNSPFSLRRTQQKAKHAISRLLSEQNTQSPKHFYCIQALFFSFWNHKDTSHKNTVRRIVFFWPKSPKIPSAQE